MRSAGQVTWGAGPKLHIKLLLGSFIAPLFKESEARPLERFSYLNVLQTHVSEQEAA